METEKLTLEERIARAARSQAASPEAAAKLIQRLARMHMAQVLHGGADLELVYGLIGPYMDQIGAGLFHYTGLCLSINLAILDNVPPAEDDTPFHPTLGARVSNAIVLLGLILLDHAKGRGWDKEVYHCTRMTLGQYLNTLQTMVFPGDEAPALKFWRWRESFLRFYDPSAPLMDVLADILRQYIHGWKMIDFLNHVLRCTEDLSSYLEEEKSAALDREFRGAMRQYIAETGLAGVEVVGEDEREQYPDPVRHYMGLIDAYSWDVPDPAGKQAKAGAVRSQIFLPDRDVSPASLRAMAEETPSPEFRALLEQLALDPRLPEAMSRINEAVSNLFMLWVAPYLWMGMLSH